MKSKFTLHETHFEEHKLTQKQHDKERNPLP